LNLRGNIINLFISIIYRVKHRLKLVAGRGGIGDGRGQGFGCGGVNGGEDSLISGGGFGLEQGLVRGFPEAGGNG